ncbi:hypothetical protein SAMN05443639_1112 [Stigmatella erecta]|jgi:hypothetical protein|uniref:Uncharacterized protein n=1 Tax=Stigmatella erecta TaxID=83460 RepID=A0A1I0KH98_9BACT|nr:hypothetical protein SAMN05443639_1112 [Stigmatella erecta]
MSMKKIIKVETVKSSPSFYNWICDIFDPPPTQA